MPLLACALYVCRNCYRHIESAIREARRATAKLECVVVSTTATDVASCVPLRPTEKPDESEFRETTQLSAPTVP